jgi:hypothetical protein
MSPGQMTPSTHGQYQQLQRAAAAPGWGAAR